MGNTREHTMTDVTGSTEERAAVYLEDTPMGVAIESIGAVLIVLFVITSTLLGCMVYPFIWLCTKLKAGTSKVSR
jgi:hypothetical protein